MIGEELKDWQKIKKLRKYLNSIPPEKFSLLGDDEKQEYLRLRRAERLFTYRYDFYAFVVEVLKAESRGEPPCQLGKVHKDLCRFLRSCKNLGSNALVMVPRYHLKTWIATIYYRIWRLVNNPELSSLIVSGTLELSKSTARFIKHELQNNQDLRDLYPHVLPDWIFNDRRNKWSETQFNVARTQNAPQCTIEAVGVEATVTGKHFGEISMDDIVTPENSTTPEQCQKVIQAYRYFSSIVNPKTGRFIVVGTPYTDSDLYTYIRDPQLISQFRVFIRPVYDKYHLPIWPGMYDESKLRQIALNQGSYVFCNPGYAPVLDGNFRIRRLDEIRVGDYVVGWKQKLSGKRTLCKSKVLRISKSIAKTVKMKMESGREVICTPNHKWFTGRYPDKENPWRKCYKEAGVGSKLMSIYEPFPTELPKDKLKDALWLGGFFDGEGSCYKRGSIWFTQSIDRNKEVCYKLESVLENLGFSFKYWINEHPEHERRGKTHSYYILGGRQAKLKFLSWCDPVKSFNVEKSLFETGTRITNREDKVLEITPFKEETVYGLETETGNYVVWGYASSNSTQYLLDPVPESEMEFKKAWIQLFRSLPQDANGNDIRLTYYILVDPITAKPTSSTSKDRGVILVVGVDKAGNWYVVDYKLYSRATEAEMFTGIFDFSEKYNTMLVGWETVAYQLQGKVNLEEEAKRTGRTLRVTPLKPGHTKKEVRIRTLIPYFERGQIFIKPWMSELLQELYRFPHGETQDILDALAYMTHMIPVKRRIWRGDNFPQQTEKQVYF